MIYNSIVLRTSLIICSILLSVLLVWKMGVIFLPLGFCIGLSLLAFKINSSSNNKFKNYSVVLAGGLLGVAFFICTLSVKLLQPSYIGWLLSGDPAQHF